MEDQVENARKELLAALKAGRRSHKFTRERPTVWQPGQVRDPRSDWGFTFTDTTCWHYIEELLKAGHEMSVIELDHPPGKPGYVMKVDVPDGEEIYIKLEVGSGYAIGRSFHYSRLIEN